MLFKKLYPPQKDIKAKIKEVLKLPVDKRSFGVMADSPSEDVSTFCSQGFQMTHHAYRYIFIYLSI